MNRRLLVTSMIASAVAFAALIATLLVLAPREILPDISRQVETLAKRPIIVDGPARLHLFPEPRAVLEEVRFQGRLSETLISVDRVTARLKILPLLVGRIEANAFQLDSPKIKLTVDQDGRTAWALYRPEEFDEMSVANPNIGRLTVVNGHLDYRNDQTGQAFEVEAISADIDWPRFLAQVTIDGSGVWNDETVAIDAEFTRPANLIFGGSSVFESTFSNSIAAGRLDARLRSGSNPGLDGALDLAISDLQGLAEWAGYDVSGALFPNQVDVDSRIIVRGPSVSLESATLILDGQTADGALSLDFSKRMPPISGTLAFEALNLETLLTNAPADATATRDPSETLNNQSNSERLAALDSTSGATDNDDNGSIIATTTNVSDATASELISREQSVDLRISAQSIGIAGMTFSDVALALTIKDGRIDLGLGNAGIAGGVFAGTATLDAATTRAVSSISLSADGVALTDFTNGPFGIDWIEGALGAAIDVTASGAEWSMIRDSALGTVEVAVRDGAFQLLDSVRLVSPGLPGVVGTIAEASLRRRARGIAFDQAVFDVALGGGNADFTSIKVLGPIVNLDGSGRVGLADGSLALSLVASPQTPDVDDSVKIDVAGALTNPVVTADLAALAALFGGR